MARKQIWGTPWDDGGYAWGWAPNDGLWLTWDGFKSTGLVGTASAATTCSAARAGTTCWTAATAPTS
jgi:hypothetical protein